VSEVSTLSSTVVALEARVTTVQDENTALKSKVAELDVENRG
jgi:hypothetical protein